MVKPLLAGMAGMCLGAALFAMVSSLLKYCEETHEEKERLKEKEEMQLKGLISSRDAQNKWCWSLQDRIEKLEKALKAEVRRK